MLGDNHNQEQKQHVEQIIQNQDSKIEITCDHYSNAYIESLEEKRKFMLNLHDGFEPETAVINRELEKARVVNLLQHQGRVTKVFCSLLSESTCTSPKHSGKRCYLLGPAPASKQMSLKMPPNF
jgi:DNA replicative helicase MCM subunit Mcm2 (Cdc46/Mcm family)